MVNKLTATSNTLPDCKQLQENYVEIIEEWNEKKL